MCSQDLENIFSNILEVHELTCNVLSQLEDTIEMTEDNEIPLVGTCIEELAEVSYIHTVWLCTFHGI